MNTNQCHSLWMYSLLFAAEVKVMSIQEHCRVGIRRLLREHIQQEFPDLGRRRRPKRARKHPSPGRGRRGRMIPMNMGMMVLGGFGDSDDGAFEFHGCHGCLLSRMWFLSCVPTHQQRHANVTLNSVCTAPQPWQKMESSFLVSRYR